MGDRRSFGSDCHTSNQSRKISIGIILDSIAERKLGAIEEDKSKQPNAERIKLTNGTSVEGKNKGEAVTASKGRQTEATEQVKSPCITPRSVHEKSLAPETASSSLGQKKHKKVKDVEAVKSDQNFSNQTFNPQNVSSKQNSFDLSYKRKGRNDGNSQKVEEFNIASAGKVLESDKVVLKSKADKTQNNQTETLKMKLQELLGNVSSPKSLLSGLQAQEVTDNSLKPKLSVDHTRDTFVKPIQNSDTLEPDSENPDQTIKRPVTRSLTRKQAPAKVPTDKTNVGSSSKQTHQESIFSFREERSTKLDGAVNTGSKLSGKKKSSKIDPRKICFTDEDISDEIKRTTYTNETPEPAGKTSILGNKMEKFPGNFNEKRRENFENVQEKPYVHSTLNNKKNQLVYCDNPASLKKGDKQDVGNISLRNVVCTPDSFQSPTFGFKAPVLDNSPSPKPKTVEREQSARSPVPLERGFTMGNIKSFRTFQASRPDSDTGVEHIKRYVHSEPSSEERLSESFEGGSPTIKRYDCCTENLISPDTVVSEKPNFMNSPIKRFQNHEDVRLSECSPTTTSRKGARIGESFWFQEPSEQDQADELTRAVTLFASALKTFKRKMDSTTRNKSSEILVSISKEIKSLLLNAQSDIESDLGKLISLNKTKRKRLEIGLQEKQEQLKHILEKFKEDIRHHLLDCNSILEGMEAHQIELKGIMKKQRAVIVTSRFTQVSLCTPITKKDENGDQFDGRISVSSSIGVGYVKLSYKIPYIFPSMRGRDFMELVWENGEVVIRGLSSKTSKRSSPFSSRSSRSRIQLIEGETCTASGSKDGVADSTFADPMSGLSTAVLGSEERCSDKQLVDSNIVSVNNKLEQHEVPNQKYETCIMGSKEKRERVNFSMFLSFGATRAKSSQGLGTGAEDLRGNNGRSLPPISSNPFENEGDSVAKKMKAPQKESLPDEQSEAVPNTRLPNKVHEPTSTSAPDGTGLKGNPEQMVESSSLCSRGASNCPTYTLKRRYEDTGMEEPEGATRGSRGAKGKRKTEVHNLSERKRRDKINKKMRALKELIPNCTKVDKASMLDEAIEYLKTLQLQAQMMSMGNGVYMPPMMFPLPSAMQHINAQHLGGYSPMAVGMGMGMGMQMGLGCGAPPQFPTSLMPGAPPLPGIPEATLNMLRSMSPSPFVSSAASFSFPPQSVLPPGAGVSQSAAAAEEQVYLPGGANPTHKLQVSCHQGGSFSSAMIYQAGRKINN
ncbi:hypothetical protein V6N11_006837 [Hibiscus sabdariffa]|uniref:BHLH domain-containing protein n=1 Tax=Hibiscus sabdariffa TaxID=183260 RepID=A0ABR2RSD6_9ROSI